MTMSPQPPPQPLDLTGRAKTLASRSWKVFRVNWHLGFTAFGGPPVHFRIVSTQLLEYPELDQCLANNDLTRKTRKTVQRQIRAKDKMDR